MVTVPFEGGENEAVDGEAVAIVAGVEITAVGGVVTLVGARVMTIVGGLLAVTVDGIKGRYEVTGFDLHPIMEAIKTKLESRKELTHLLFIFATTEVRWGSEKGAALIRSPFAMTHCKTNPLVYLVYHFN